MFKRFARLTASVAVGLGLLLSGTLPAVGQQLEVLTETASGSGVFTSVGLITPLDDSGNSPAQTYNFGGVTPSSYGGTLVAAQNETANLFVARNSDGNYHAYVVLDATTSGSGGSAGVQFDLTGTNSAGVFNVEVQDDVPPSDTYGGAPGSQATASFNWSAGFTDGGAWGPLSDDEPWILNFRLTAQTGLTGLQLVHGSGSIDLSGLEIGARVRLRPAREVVITKTVVPDTDPGRFNTFLDGFFVAELGHGEQASAPAGIGTTITVNELAAAGTNLADYTSTVSCTGDGLGAPQVGDTTVNFNLPPGVGPVTCAFTNSQPTKTITMNKVVVPAGNPGQFQLAVNGTPVYTGGHGGSGALDVLEGTTVTVSELEVAGTPLANYDTTVACVGDGLPGTPVNFPASTLVPRELTFDVPVGGSPDIVCTWTNTFIPPGPTLTTCIATAVPPVVRAEGIAELVGDIVLTCQNATQTIPANAVVKTNVSVSLNVNVTNNIDFGSAEEITDAVLVINENNCTTPSELGSTYNCGSDVRFQDPQFGRLAANNRLEWNEVDFPIPNAISTINQTQHPSVTTVRITSMRGNASQLGVPNAATFPSTQITAFVSITGPTTIPVTNNVLNVAVPILGLLWEVDSDLTGLQCIDDEGYAVLTLEEGFATSFKTIGVATYVPGNTQWESGYYAISQQGGTSNNGAGATQGTRFLLQFFGIPEGVEIEVPEYIDHGNVNATGDALALAIVTGADSDGQGGSHTTSTDTSATDSVSLSGGFGTVVYEVVDSNPFLVEDCDINIHMEWEADTTNDLPAVGSGSLSASFAPISTVTTASDGEAEPRFIEDPGDPETIVTIVRCTTTLLFPFVTNQAGFDTGLAISNTSKDWLGTDPQNGACDIHYHGSTTGGGAAPPTQRSQVIAAGDQLIFVLSGGNPAQGIAGAPEFQGYIIAVCEFQYGHGFRVHHGRIRRHSGIGAGLPGAGDSVGSGASGFRVCRTATAETPGTVWVRP